MAGTSYKPGSWFGVIRGGTVVLLAPDTAPALVGKIWNVLEQGPEAHEVLHEVTDGFGVSLSRIPPFGIIDAGSSLRVFLRGELELAVTGGRGSETVHGRDVTTWTERRFEAPESYRLDISAARSVPGRARSLPGQTRSVPGEYAGADGWLPLSEGVVMLSGLSVTQISQSVSSETVMDFEPLDLELTIVPTQLQEPAPEGVSDSEPGPSSQPVGEADPEQAAADQDTEDKHAADQDAAERDTADQDAADKDAEDLNAAEQDTEEIRADDVETEEVTAEEPRGGLVPDSELTSNYDHLWEKTVMRNIEDAAVRLDPDADPQPEAGAGSAAAAGPATQGTAGSEGQNAGEHSSAADAPARDQESDTNQESDPNQTRSPNPPAKASPAAAPAAAASAPPPWTPPSLLPEGGGSGLIDSVPWVSSSRGASQSAPQKLAPARPQPPAAQQPPAQQLSSAAEGDADHDGQTVMKGSLGGLAAGLGQAAGQRAGQTAGPTPSEAPGNGPTVLARVCAHGHANPPTYAQCAACGMALPGDAVQVPRPSLGKVRLSTGDVIELDQSLIIGRQPSVSRVQGGSMPRLVQVASPGGDISRSHVEVRLEGWHVMLCDLKATNGTVLVRDGQPPRRLAQSEMAILLDGDIAELGDGISLRFEEIL